MIDSNGTRVIKIVNKKGLHARASARFVRCVEQFDADIRVSKDGHIVGDVFPCPYFSTSSAATRSVAVTADVTDKAHLIRRKYVALITQFLLNLTDLKR